MKNAPSPEALARVVRWAILLFIAYALLNGTFHFRSVDHAPPPLAGSVAMKESQMPKECGSENGLNNFSMIAASLLPASIPVIRREDVKSGAGEGAICGQAATLHLEYALENGTVLYSDMKGEPAQATIGSGQLLKGVEEGMLGMKPGAERKLTFPAALAFAAVGNPASLIGAEALAPKMGGLKGAIIVAKVALVSLSPALPVTSLPLRVIDHRFGGGARAQCGDRVEIDLTLWKLDGSKIFSTLDKDKPLAFTLGLSEVPFGIEQSALGLTAGAERTVILPAAYAKPLVTSDSDETNPLGVALPEETTLMEIRLRHIGGEVSASKPKPAKAPSKPPAPKKSDDTDD